MKVSMAFGLLHIISFDPATRDLHVMSEEYYVSELDCKTTTLFYCFTKAVHILAKLRIGHSLSVFLFIRPSVCWSACPPIHLCLPLNEKVKRYSCAFPLRNKLSAEDCSFSNSLCSILYYTPLTGMERWLMPMDPSQPLWCYSSFHLSNLAATSS